MAITIDGIQPIILGSGQTYQGTDKNDFLDAGTGTGNNIIKGGNGDDDLFANTNDKLFGESGNDTLDSRNGHGSNTLSGGDGNDTIFTDLNDVADGGTGNDVIYAGQRGGNTLTGGLGKDVFWIAITDIPVTPNTIADFNPVSDTIRVKLAEVTQLSDLTFTQSGADAIISLTAGGKQQLAIVKDTLISNLNATTVAVVDSTPNNSTVNQAPTITAATFSIDENSVFNTLIGQVVANDPNTGDKITFGITSGNTDVNGNGKTPFAIDSKTGKITVNDSGDLDFEKTKTFSLGITATDAEGLSAQSVFPINLKDVFEPVTTSKSGSDVFTLSSGNDPKPSFLFTINSNNAKQTSEIGIFVVDDDAGTIDGVSPINTVEYAKRALSKSKVVFSIIDNLPSGFSENGLSRLVEFDSTVRIRFYSINDKSATADSVLKNQSYDKFNFSPIKDLSLADLGGGDFSINFNGLDISVNPSSKDLEIGTGLQDKTEGEVLDLTQGIDTTKFSQIKAEFTVNREAAFNNFVGFYKIENAKGDIKKADGSIVSVGQSGYVQAAVAGQISGIDLTAANQTTQTTSGIFKAGSIFAPFIVVNGSPSAILDSNPNNDPAVYFPFLGANTDKVDHIRLLANNTFGFEDLPSGGDFDYNDIIVKVKLTPVA